MKQINTSKFKFMRNSQKTPKIIRFMGQTRKAVHDNKLIAFDFSPIISYCSLHRYCQSLLENFT